MKLKCKIVLCTSIFLFSCSFTPSMPGDEPFYLDSVSFEGKNYANIHCSYQNDLGRIYHIDEVFHDYADFVVRENWFFGAGNEYKQYPLKVSEVYKFKNYVDLPIITLSNDYVNSDNTLKKTFTTTYSETYSYKQVYNFAYSKMATMSLTYNIGLGVAFDPINFIENMSCNFEISESLKKELSYTSEQAYLFEQVSTEEINYTNNHDFNVYYQRAYRQRYEVYFINVFPCMYEQQIKASDMWGKNYTYLQQYGKGISCSYIFRPVDSPYFHSTIYKDCNDGAKEVLNLQNDSVVFF